MLNIKNISFKLIIFTISLISIIIIYSAYFRIIPAQEKNLYNDLYNRVITTAQLSKPLINKALELNDDLLLLAQIQTIVELDDILNAYIINDKKKVLIHNNTTEWDKIYNNTYTQKAIQSNKNAIQRIDNTSSLLFSSKINPSLTLCIELSTQKLQITLSNIKKSINYNLIMLLVIIIIFIVIFVRLQINKKFNLFNNILESVIKGNGGIINIKTKDEFGKLAILLNEIITQKSEIQNNAQTNIKQTKENSFYIIQTMIDKYIQKAILVFDEENKLMVISEEFNKNKLSLDATLQDGSLRRGSHLLEIKQLEYIFDTIKQSMKTPNNILNAKINNESINVTSIFNNNIHLCTIVGFN